VGTKIEARGSGAAVVEALKRKFRDDMSQAPLTDKALSRGLGGIAIAPLKKAAPLTSRQISTLVHKAYRAGQSNLQKTAVQPIVEFYELAQSGGRTKQLLFDVGQDLYRQGLQEQLATRHGVYVFFDSRGRALYVGKAKRLTLWEEATNAFNRDRKDVQAIRRVNHPTTNRQYKTYDEKGRQIRKVRVALCDIAAYISAYAVVEGMIDDIEAMLMRCFANDLLNARMEQFGPQRAKGDVAGTKRRARDR
jgi:hypothetical protein